MESKLLKTEIDYEEKYWKILEEYAEFLQYLGKKAPLTLQAWNVHKGYENEL
jgi:hypothetical protein